MGCIRKPRSKFVKSQSPRQEELTNSRQRAHDGELVWLKDKEEGLVAEEAGGPEPGAADALGTELGKLEGLAEG